MFKKIVAIASVTALLATATPAFAHGYYRDDGGNAAGLLAFGAIAGLMIGAVVASHHHEEAPPVYYAPPGYYPPQGYYAPAPAYYPYPPATYAR
jgi:hypothetical protein